MKARPFVRGDMVMVNFPLDTNDPILSGGYIKNLINDDCSTVFVPTYHLVSSFWNSDLTLIIPAITPKLKIV